jgi:hypothetical protein
VIAKLRKNTGEMDKAYLSGRGDLSKWTPEIMKKIDEIFVKNFVMNGEPVDFLFFPNNAEYLNAYNKYLLEVDEVFVEHQDKLPKYCREYLTYYSIWEMRDYKFPVPIGTASVVECLYKIANGRRKGFVEVSMSSIACRSPGQCAVSVVRCERCGPHIDADL